MTLEQALQIVEALYPDGTPAAFKQAEANELVRTMGHLTMMPDLARLRRDRDQLWAEAVHAYRQQTEAGGATPATSHTRFSKRGRK